MWMILLMLVGLFFLFFPLLGFFFPFLMLLMLLMPVFFMFSRPSVKVYTRTFTPNDLNSNRSSTSSNMNSRQSLPNVIDVDYTERDI